MESTIKTDETTPKVKGEEQERKECW